MIRALQNKRSNNRRKHHEHKFKFVILAFGVLCICWVMSILIKKCPTCDSNKMNVIPICEIERYRTQEMETIFP